MINCLRDCRALCCKSQELTFPFSEEEAKMLEEAGSKLSVIQTAIGPLYHLKKCAFLNGNLCLLHNNPKQPKCCQKTKPGSFTCLSVRKNKH